MEGMELIRHRRSVRTFDGNALRADDAEKILDYAARAENPYGIEIRWKLLHAGKDHLRAPVITGADTYIAGCVRRMPHAEEAFGYTFERVVLFAEAMGIGTTWIAGTMDRPAFEKALGLQEDEVMPCVSPLGYPADRMSLRETMMRRGVKADARMEFSELFFDGNFDRPLVATAPWQESLEMVRWAPSAVNKQPWRIVVRGQTAHVYEKHSKGYVNASGWDLQKVDIGIAMLHLVYGLECQGYSAHLTLEDPGIPVPEGMEYVGSFVLRYKNDE